MDRNNQAPRKIFTPRLMLRCWEDEDAFQLAGVIRGSLEHLRPWMTWASPEAAEVETVGKNIERNRSAFEQGEDYVYGIFSPAGTHMIGSCGLHARGPRNMLEIGYWIRVDQIGRGYATEAAAALTRVGFELFQKMKLEIHCAVGNTASAAVARRLNYRLEGTLRIHSELYDERWTDSQIWGLLSDEFPSSCSSRIDLQAWSFAGDRLL